jgi:hypothetical protein
MTRKCLRYSSLCLATLISMSACMHQEEQKQLEFPPSYSNTLKAAITVPFCQLVNDPAQYDKQVVRVKAIYFRGMENAYLTDPTCNRKDSYLWVEFDDSYVYQDAEIKGTLEKILCSSQPCPTGRAEVIAVGRFSGPSEGPYGHLDDYHFKFSIFRVEQVGVAAANAAALGAGLSTR